MIKNRNIAKNAGINPSKIAGGMGSYSVREIRRVVKANTALSQYLETFIEADHLFGTVTLALARATNYSVVYVEDGIYDEGAELAITQAGLKLIGANTSGIEWGPCSLKQSSANHHVISIQANGIEVAGLGFIVNGAYRGIELDHTAAVYKTHIHDCHFGGSATATYGVYAGGTFDAVDTVIEDCEFLSWATAGIYMNATRSKARNNLIYVPDSGIGIEYVPNAGDRPYGAIHDNNIVGTGTTDTGIQLDGNPTAGTVSISDNNVSGCATLITTRALFSDYGTTNYGGSDAGGAIIDTDT
jgi:hypothetical protein